MFYEKFIGLKENPLERGQFNIKSTLDQALTII